MSAPKPKTGRVPPHDLDAEAAVLSALMLDGKRFHELDGVLTAPDFYSEANRWIYVAITAIEREGREIDSVTVAAWLRQNERLAQVGGTPYLAQLTDATPDVAHVVEHGLIVARAAYVRRLIAKLHELVALGYDARDAVEFGQFVEQSIFQLSQWGLHREETSILAELVPETVEALMREARAGAEDRGDAIPTGIDSLDGMLDGGYVLGNKYTAAGRPGMGKSALGLTGVIAAARAGWGSILVSAEMPKGQLMRRLLSQETGVPFGRLKNPEQLTPEHWNYVTGQMKRLERMPLAIVHVPRATPTQVRSAVRREYSKLRRQHGDDLRLGLVTVDHVHIMDGERQYGESREGEITRISKANLGLAGEFGCAVLDLAQLNREVEKRTDKRPNMSDLRDSGSLEEDAYALLFPFRPEYYKKDRPIQTEDSKPEPAEIVVAKHRNGNTGSVNVAFHGPTMRFTA